jgi:hypothetical protein
MRDLYKTIAHIEHVLTRGLERTATASPPRGKPKPSPRAWHAPATDTLYPEIFRSTKDKPVPPLTLTAGALKVTAALDAAMVAALPTPDGQSRSKLTITCDGTNYTADVATKSLRKVKTTIATNGAENVFVMVQGKLRNTEIIECGIVAQVKVHKEKSEHE